MSFCPKQLRLIKDDDPTSHVYLIEHKVRFGAGETYCHQISPQVLKQCLEFSWEMTYGDGHHRAHRSGGSEHRNLLKMFENVLTGKLGEVAFHSMCVERGRCQAISEIDFASYGMGQWDDYDFEVTSKTNKTYKVAVKSSQHYANLLLLEVADWVIENDNADTGDIGKAVYLHHQQNHNVYDYLIFCRVKFNDHSSGEPDFFRHYASKLPDKQTYEHIAKEVSIKAEVVGYVINADLVKVMTDGHVINKGDYMTQNSNKQGMRLDADNYYIQAGCLRKIKPI